MQSDFRVETQTVGRTSTLTLTGELDLLSSPILEQELQRALDAGAELVVVDLRQLAFMDSTGLHVVVAAQQRLHEAGRRLVLIRGGVQVQRLFELTGLGQVLAMVDSPDELLEVDRAPGSP
jgi:anti-sigma B factor antagonist